jgi:hypothetical protein
MYGKMLSINERSALASRLRLSRFVRISAPNAPAGGTLRWPRARASLFFAQYVENYAVWHSYNTKWKTHDCVTDLAVIGWEQICRGALCIKNSLKNQAFFDDSHFLTGKRVQWLARGVTPGRAAELAMKEACRLVTVREGDKVLWMPAIPAVPRSQVVLGAPPACPDRGDPGDRAANPPGPPMKVIPWASPSGSPPR